MSHLTEDDLNQIRFIDKAALGPNRVIPTLSFYVDGEWHAWIKAEDKLIKMQMWPVESHYFGDVPERETDQCFSLLHLLAQHTFGPLMDRPFTALFNDIQNLAVSLAKCRFFYTHRETDDLCARRVLETEVEYIVTTCRGVYDLLQELISDHWRMIKLQDGSNKQELPKKRFAKMVDGSPTPGQLTSRYGLTDQFSQWYVDQEPFFAQLKSIRDRLMHNGANLELLYMTERGMAVQKEQKPFSDLYQWPADVEIQNGLVPLRPVLCKVIFSTIEACNSFARVLAEHIAVPLPVAPGLQFYSRGYHDRELASLESCIETASWCGDA